VKLKRTGNIFLLLVLLVATTGVTWGKQYCGDYLSERFFQEADSCCNRSCDCCQDVARKVKLNTDLVATSIVQILYPSQFGIDLFFSELTGNLKKKSGIFFSVFNNHSPPPLKIRETLSGLQIYLL